MKKKTLLTLALASLMLVACGGGGDNTPSESGSSNEEESSVIEPSEESSEPSEESSEPSEESSESSEESSEEPVEPGNLVYVNLNSVSWSNVYAYTWGGSDLGAWPGSQMTLDSETSYYVYDLGETTTTNIIFGNGESQQTIDLSYDVNYPVYTLTSANIEGKYVGYWSDLEGNVQDTNVYTHEDWTTVGNAKGYHFVEDKIVVLQEEETIRDGGAHWNTDSPTLLINNEERGKNYTVEVAYNGSFETAENENVAGVVAWYQDLNNYLVIGTQWANWDRAHEIRTVFVTGKVGGAPYAWADNWADNSQTSGADGIKSLKVTKTGKTFEYSVTSGYTNQVFKSGSFNVDAAATDTAKVGIFGANHEFEFTSFEAADFTPVANVVYTSDSGTLTINTAADNFTLVKDGVTYEGTYTNNGTDYVLTSGSNVFHCKVYKDNGNNNVYKFYTPNVITGTTLKTTVNNSSETLSEGLTGDYTLEFKYKGTVSEQGSSMKLGINPWYKDGSNHLNYYIEWKGGDRNYEISNIQPLGFIGGNQSAWDDQWCDNSLSLPADGGTIRIEKVGNTFTFKLVTGTGYTKEFIKVFDGSAKPAIDTAATYSVRVYSEGDSFEIYDYVLTQA